MTAKIVVKTVVGALPALGSPIIILGCIFGGITTPTEASVIAVLYSFIIGMFVYREIKVKDIFQVLLKSAKSTAEVMYIRPPPACLHGLFPMPAYPRPCSLL